MNLLTVVSNFFDRKKVFNGSLGFILGLGLGFFIKDVILWQRKEEGYLQEILKEMFHIKTSVNKLQRKLKKIEFANKSLEAGRNTNATIDGFELDNFQDAQSYLEDTESFYSFNEEVSDDCDGFIDELDEMLRETSVESYERCYQLCSQFSWKYQDFSQFLWRYAMISYRTTMIKDLDYKSKTERITSAFELAFNAVKRSPKLSEAHKWLAILYGVVGLLSDNKKKITNGYKFKEHIDVCLKLNPVDAYAYLLKGRFCYQVSNLAFYERKLATLLFGTPPSSTFEEALECFKKCEELSPRVYAENHYYMSLCYKSLRDYAQAQKWLESAKTISLTIFDEETKSQLAAA